MVAIVMWLRSRRDGERNLVCGQAQHTDAVARLQASYRTIAPGSPVRLAKSTSNLFRPRSALTQSGLEVSGLTGVISIDPDARLADVQGMCTYESLVDATLRHGLIPLVVPQLRTITLGGAVSGLGIESTSFRNGLPHESVVEMDIFTGAGEVITVSATNEHAALFRAFPNSYGSLGYATRLRIELEPIAAQVSLRHVRFRDLDTLSRAIEEIVRSSHWDGESVDGIDGVVFNPDEAYLSLARWDQRDDPTSDYTGDQIYFRSLQHRRTDRLSANDYLWRWDTDWFWCSGAFGLHRPIIRRLWPRRYRRSDVYHKLVGLDSKYGIADRLDRRAGRPKRERVVQDIEVPVDRLAEFLVWFDEEVGMRPVWLCPLRLRGGPWPSYPLDPDLTYVNVGFWGTKHVGPDADQAPTNRAIEEFVGKLGGHKSLYSEAFYDRASFDELYAGENLAQVKSRYDPDGRLTTLYDKAVRGA